MIRDSSGSMVWCTRFICKDLSVLLVSELISTVGVTPLGVDYLAPLGLLSVRYQASDRIKTDGPLDVLTSLS